MINIQNIKTWLLDKNNIQFDILNWGGPISTVKRIKDCKIFRLNDWVDINEYYDFLIHEFNVDLIHLSFSIYYANEKELNKNNFFHSPYESKAIFRGWCAINEFEDKIFKEIEKHKTKKYV